MPDDRFEPLATLLKEVGPAHHRAFEQTDGADAEWPLWYAGHILGRARAVLGQDITQSELVYLLVGADRAHRSTRGDQPWPEFYARFFLDNL